MMNFILLIIVQVLGALANEKAEQTESYLFNSTRLLYDSTSDQKWSVNPAMFTYIAPDPFNEDQYIVAQHCILYTFHSVDKTLQYLAGDPQKCGFADGTATSALFRNIRGLQVSPDEPSQVWVSDPESHCIRLIDLNTNEVSTFAGLCEVIGDSDGLVAAARMGRPTGITVHPQNTSEAYIYDNEYKVLKRLYMEPTSRQWTIETFVSWEEECQGLSYGYRGNYIYISYITGVGVVELTNATSDYLIGYNGIGSKDGPISSASLSSVRQVIWLGDEMLMVADYGSSSLRLMDLAKDATSTLCIETEKSGKCKDIKPISITKAISQEQRIIILTSGRIYELGYQAPQSEYEQQEIANLTVAAKIQAKVDSLTGEHQMPIIYGVMAALSLMILGTLMFLYAALSSGEEEEEEEQFDRNSKMSRDSYMSYQGTINHEFYGGMYGGDDSASYMKQGGSKRRKGKRGTKRKPKRRRAPWSRKKKR